MFSISMMNRFVEQESPERPLSEGEAQELASILHRQLGRNLRKARRRLFHDLLSLSSGLRDVVMLDYVVASREELRPLLGSLARLPRLADTRLLHMGGCLYLAKLAALLQRVPTSSTPPTATQPLGVVVDEGEPRFVTAVECLSFHDHLRQFASGLAAAAASAPEAQQPAPPLCIDLEGLLMEQPLPLPSLNGWLLGYPAVYLFHLTRGPRAARCLSSASLHLFQLRACCRYNVDTEQRSPNTGHQRTGNDIALCSFSVPASLSTQQFEEPWAQAFKSEILRKLAKNEDRTWETLTFDCTLQAPQTIAL
ncbi:hypothetical protein KFL_004610100 [Klebsormidium nitens]|uniref:Uncharacterized protein n=1 Tax=Klebsormidium nitens TaxID=105231 RepID=A0A1Y1ICY4_KLENI|nr:hypothetical protein KFL_004610100 [Klebsormidium nitens]|eukprot:GAQ88815.1 hypothetical protein KFL_004610100 [Klebsormidium nitens]